MVLVFWNVDGISFDISWWKYDIIMIWYDGNQNGFNILECNIFSEWFEILKLFKKFNIFYYFCDSKLRLIINYLSNIRLRR